MVLDARLPRYEAIARELALAITSGRLGVGEQLPTEAAIAANFKVSRHTAREALRVVGQLGLVERRQGSGTRVKAAAPPARFHQVVQSLDDLLQYGHHSRLMLERSERVRASAELARQLQVARGTPVLKIAMLRHQVGHPDPLALTEVYVIPRRGIDVRRLLDPAEAVYVLVRMVDVYLLARVEQTFTATVLDARTAARLRVKAGTAALVATRRFFDAEGRLIVLAVSTHRGDRFAYTSVLTRETG
jgi:DNA-binding GntR family transcriptional regulator